MQLDPDFAPQLLSIYEAHSLLTLAQKRLTDAEEGQQKHEIMIHSAAVRGLEQTLAKAYEELGRAIFKEHQRATGEYPQVLS